MKTLAIILSTLLLNTMAYSQANENENDRYLVRHDIIITKIGKVMHVVKQGAGISVKVDGKTVSGYWAFKAMPDVVTIYNDKGLTIGTVALNKQKTLKIVTPEPKGGMSVGVGIGPVGVSSMGPGYSSFKMENYKAKIIERMETEVEKSNRETREAEAAEKERKALEKQAKKAMKKNK